MINVKDSRPFNKATFNIKPGRFVFVMHVIMRAEISFTRPGCTGGCLHYILGALGVDGIASLFQAPVTSLVNGKAICESAETDNANHCKFPR